MGFFQLNYLFISIIKLRVAYYEFPYFGLYMHTVTTVWLMLLLYIMKVFIYEVTVCTRNPYD